MRFRQTRLALGVTLGIMVPALTAAPTLAATTVTSYSYSSDAGDYIGQGLSNSYSSPAAAISVSGIYGWSAAPSPANGVEFTVTSGTDWWYVNLVAAPGQNLAVGTYTGAERAAFRTAGHPGLDVYGDGRGCNALTGDFTVKTMHVTASGVIDQFDATFTQHCESTVPALRGEVKLNVRVRSH